MGFIHIPFLPRTQPRHSFDRLRSFHLVPGQGPVIPLATGASHAIVGGTNSNKFVEETIAHVRAPTRSRWAAPRAINGMVPIPPIFYFGLAILCSVIFVLTIPSVFHGVDAQEPAFKNMLDELSQTNPGIVLLGENVDVDVDEPSVTIRWSILACGQEYVLPASYGVHGSDECGLPSSHLFIFVDGDTDPTATYNPELIPHNTLNGERRSIQNLVQFDSDHVLDVHNDRLYPFDSYLLSSTLRATSFENNSIPINRLATIDATSSFIVETVDVESYGTSTNNTELPSRDIDMRIRRPIEARAITLLLFASSWFLTHICIGTIILARSIIDVKPILKLLIINGATLLGLPSLRNSMPDAPGLDGVLIDTIGFFPQMIIVGFSIVILLLTVIARELDRSERRSLHMPPVTRRGNNLPGKPRPPPLPLPTSTSAEIAKYDIHRIAKHLKGEFVFPPVRIEAIPESPRSPRSPRTPTHRRFKTVGFASPTASAIEDV